MSNWTIKLEDRRNKITAYDCGLFSLDIVFNANLQKAVIYGTRQEARDIISHDKELRSEVYRTWKIQKVYVYPQKVEIKEIS